MFIPNKIWEQMKLYFFEHSPLPTKTFLRSSMQDFLVNRPAGFNKLFAVRDRLKFRMSMFMKRAIYSSF